jgi:hypothetical protein
MLDPEDDARRGPHESVLGHVLGHANGAAEPAVSKSLARDPAPPAVAELAASCMRFVFAKYKVPLDFTQDTLGVLDHYLKEARADLKVRPEGQTLIEAAAGAYFGEVVRGVFESTWRADGPYPEWRLSMSEVYLSFNPLGMAREALTLADAPGWQAHLEMHKAEQRGRRPPARLAPRGRRRRVLRAQRRASTSSRSPSTPCTRSCSRPGLAAFALRAAIIATSNGATPDDATREAGQVRSHGGAPLSVAPRSLVAGRFTV